MDQNSLSTLSGSPWWKDILLFLIGGGCAVAGSVLATILSIKYQTKKARQMKMEETIGRQKVNACKKALRLADQLKSILIQGTEDDVLGFMKTENPWVLDNEILLPTKFVVNWHSVRQNILSVRRKDQAQRKKNDGPERDKIIEEIVGKEAFARELAKEAEDVIRSDLDLPPFKIQRPNKTYIEKNQAEPKANRRRVAFDQRYSLIWP